MVVLAHDPHVPPETFASLGAPPCGPEDLAGRCDVVSLHLPAGEVVATEGWLAVVQRRPLLVNTAGSSLGDPVALAGAIRTGW